MRQEAVQAPPPMTENAAERAQETVDVVCRSESRRILATLIRLLGDFELAEEALHDAFAAALAQWPTDAVPANPRAYTLQAAIAAVHAEAPDAAATDWARIVGLYDLLARAEPSPVVELNRAVAVAMRDGPQAGLALIDAILPHGDLADYHLAHSARADPCRRLGRTAEARAAYERALALARQEPERRFLERRLGDLPG